MKSFDQLKPDHLKPAVVFALPADIVSHHHVEAVHIARGMEENRIERTWRSSILSKMNQNTLDI